MRTEKKIWNMKMTVIPIVIGVLGTVTKRLILGLKYFENKRTNGDHPDNNIIYISLISEKSPGDLSRLAVIQIPGEKISPNTGVKNSQRRK